MKKSVSFALVLILLLSLAACTPTPAPQETTPGTQQPAQTEKPVEPAPPNAAEVYELALITDLGTIDDKSFNQGAWEGLVRYAEEANIPHKYYQPSEKSDDAYLQSIDLAVKGGAKLIVTPGFLFEVPIFLAQDTYPDVRFILLDGTPHSADYTNYKVGDNTVSITYAEDESGFLAGYAAVKDGNTKLGFMGGMAVPAVVRFGYGFVQGAEMAAQELGLADGSVTINYFYTGGFDATPEAKAMAASWYNDGAEVIFGCGGAVGNSVMAAAEEAGKKVIGVDKDQSAESATVITSAMKMLQDSVYDATKAFKDGVFPGGQSLIYGATNNGVGLPMATSKFEKFSAADYEAIYKKLVDGSIKLVKDVDAAGAEVKVKDIPVKAVKVNEI